MWFIKKIIYLNFSKYWKYKLSTINRRTFSCLFSSLDFFNSKLNIYSSIYLCVGKLFNLFLWAINSKNSFVYFHFPSVIGICALWINNVNLKSYLLHKVIFCSWQLSVWQGFSCIPWIQHHFLPWVRLIL